MVKSIKLPALQSLPLCPVQAVKNLLLLTPGNQDTPLFQIKYDKAQWVPLTDTKIRRNFSLFPVLAFNSNVALQNIQSHGTFTSDCVWRYIVQDHVASQEVANAFQSLFSTPTATS